MQKRSHRLLAKTLLDRCDGFRKRRFEVAFLFGSFEPDCNPLSYLKGSLHCKKFGGHNFPNSRGYIDAQIRKLQAQDVWTTWQYYTLGKLTHYLADAFTFPHNETYPDSLLAHRRYEEALRVQLADYLARHDLCETLPGDLPFAVEQLHSQYLDALSDWQRDIRYILAVNELLMFNLVPQETPA